MARTQVAASELGDDNVDMTALRDRYYKTRKDHAQWKDGQLVQVAVFCPTARRYLSKTLVVVEVYTPPQVVMVDKGQKAVFIPAVLIDDKGYTYTPDMFKNVPEFLGWV